MFSASLAFLAAGCESASAGASPQTGAQKRTDWAEPTCDLVQGTNAVTFTRDEGATLASTSAPLKGIVYTKGLAALDTVNTLLAASGDTLLRSTDAGCSWSTVGTLAPGLTLTAAPGGRAYAWEVNGSHLYRIEGNGGSITALASPVPNILGLGVDPADGSHVRLGDLYGQLHESFDGGASWTRVGVPVASGENVIGYVVAFDPANLHHVLYGQAVQGASVSTDGGATWTRVRGLPSERVNVFSIAISPANGQVVWLEGLDVTATPDRRQLFRSVDGGRTFSPVVSESDSVKLTNGILLAPHPVNADVIFFEFGMSFGNYGTDIYKYDGATGAVTTTHNRNDDVSAMAFSPANPSVMYFGLSSEHR